MEAMLNVSTSHSYLPINPIPAEEVGAQVERIESDAKNYICI